jgi:hypothetical protein
VLQVRGRAAGSDTQAILREVSVECPRWPEGVGYLPGVLAGDRLGSVCSSFSHQIDHEVPKVIVIPRVTPSSTLETSIGIRSLISYSTNFWTEAGTGTGADLLDIYHHAPISQSIQIYHQPRKLWREMPPRGEWLCLTTIDANLCCGSDTTGTKHPRRTKQTVQLLLHMRVIGPLSLVASFP